MNDLIYIGNSFIVGVPAKNIKASDVEKYGGEKYLLDTGLYRVAKKTTKKKEAK